MLPLRNFAVLGLLLAGIAAPAWADYATGYQAYRNGDYKTALVQLQPLAKAGDGKAERILGKLYADGLGVTQDYKQAALWFQRSADHGDIAAMADLGDLYFYGNGVRQDEHEALRWYRQGAERGDPEAEYDYGLVFHDGSAGQKRDFDMAMKWFLRAAAQGQGAALNMVGYMHDMGEGVPENPSEAVRWYKKAADKGFEVAQYNLGVMYQSGRGVEKDFAAAAKWYAEAADQGDADSEASLGYLYEQGLGVEANIARAITWYRAAARQDSSRALNNLGVLYHDGTGVTRNLVNAYVLYALAADKAQDSDDRKLAEDNRNDVAKELSAAELAQAKVLRQQASANLELVLPSGSGPEADAGSRDHSKTEPGATAPETASKSPDKSAVVPTQPSSPNTLIATVKTALAALGYDPGAKDSSLSDEAVAAIKAFQKDRGLPVTGDISPELLGALLASRFEASNASKTVTLSPGTPKLKLYATGSGFYISAQGDIITNQHVVDGCVEVRLPGGDPLQILTADKVNDLALLHASRPGPAFVRLRDGRGVRTGEAIMIAGFPLHDEISNDLNVTTGNVSALAGPENDRTLIQITAPVQHGNSGGPVLDLSAHLVGVVQSKFDPTADTGDDNTIDVPQNVNFAVSANLLRSFLDAQDVNYESEPSKTPLTPAAIAEQARSFTVSLECWQ
jgi:TPR repeat protein/S1-C subfamily serine protease